MSRAIEAAFIFAVGVIAGGAAVYTASKSTPTAPSPTRSPPPRTDAVRKDVLVGDTMSSGANTPRNSLLIVELRRLLQYGHPGPVFDAGNRTAFISSYDRRMRNPSWV